MFGETNGADKKTIEETALDCDNVKRHLSEQNIKKIIIVPGKLVNIVI